MNKLKFYLFFVVGSLNILHGVRNMRYHRLKGILRLETLNNQKSTLKIWLLK